MFMRIRTHMLELSLRISEDIRFLNHQSNFHHRSRFHLASEHAISKIVFLKSTLHKLIYVIIMKKFK